jgi:uncharacterized protein (TIGR02594 family)
METSVIEVVMGLALTYATLALLLMKVQESLFGDKLRGRVVTLHEMVLEAVHQDQELASKLFANPLIYSMSQGEADAKPSAWFTPRKLYRRATGPSFIAPDLFARALLMELNNGKHPRHDFATPLNFLDKRMKDQAEPKRTALLKGIHGLSAGREADWDAFESAIATWFKDIGDRADGWFKRSSDRFSFRAALILCAALNVDALHLINSLSADPELRIGLANLAEDVSRLREAEQAGASAPAGGNRPLSAASPVVRVSARLADANAHLREAYQRDDAIAAFGHDLQLLRDYCYVVPEIGRSAPKPLQKNADRGDKAKWALNNRFASNSDAWLEVIPALLPVIEAAANGMELPGQEVRDKPEPSPALRGSASRSAASGVVSNNMANGGGAVRGASGAVMQTPDPTGSSPHSSPKSTSVPAEAVAAPPATGVAVVPHDPDKTAQGKLKQAYVCLTQVSAWVRAASTVSDNVDIRRLMLEAASALEDSKSALIALVTQPRLSTNLRNLFLSQPENFRACVKEARGSRENLLDCMRRDQELLTQLPIGWTEATYNRQFCKARVVDHDRSYRGTSGACPGERVDADIALGLPAMAIEPKPYAWAFWLVGVFISALFVALGAPFWFDLLSRLVKLRAAGKVRESQDDDLKGRGSRPLPDPIAGSKVADPGAGSVAGSDRMPAAVQGSKNRFEDQLLTREVMALQAVLAVKQTGWFDPETRTAIRNAQSERGLGNSDTLSLASYTAIVRRPPEQADVDLGQSGARAQRGQSHPFLGALCENLKAILRMTHHAVDSSVYSDDLRALAVLYRIKKARHAQSGAVANLEVIRQARENPTVLDELDEVLANEILRSRDAPNAFDRDAVAAWMDWAWGELGQVEKNATSVAASNPRICEYLRAAVLNSEGDATPWCGAFVAWVLKRHNTVDSPATAQPLAAQPLAAAGSWRTWTRVPAGQKAPTYGDVVVVLTNPNEADASKQKFHVGFFVESEGDHFQMLGGNQAEGGRVCLSRWPSKDIRRQ